MNCRTAEQLRIEQWELDRLIEVRGMLATGAISRGKDKKLAFDMGVSAEELYDCGSCCCIGGWMYALQNGERLPGGMISFNRVDADAYVRKVIWGGRSSHAHPLGCLFYPAGWNMDEITEAQAVEAIDNFLRTGDPDWASILRGTSADWGED